MIINMMIQVAKTLAALTLLREIMGRHIHSEAEVSVPEGVGGELHVVLLQESGSDANVAASHRANDLKHGVVRDSISHLQIGCCRIRW